MITELRSTDTLRELLRPRARCTGPRPPSLPLCLTEEDPECEGATCLYAQALEEASVPRDRGLPVLREKDLVRAGVDVGPLRQLGRAECIGQSVAVPAGAPQECCPGLAPVVAGRPC